MAASAPELVFNTDFAPKIGEPVDVAPGLVRISAPNASPYTFTGTNSFLLGHNRMMLIDPGPDDERHLQALRRAIADRPVAAILLTHTHRDHSASAVRLRAELGAPLWFGGQHQLSRPLRRWEINPIKASCDWALVPDETLPDGERFSVDGIEIETIATPGHCANHLAFGLVGTPTLLTGDHVMGWNSTLISVPDGSMSDYFGSLDRLQALPYSEYVPAHGGPIKHGPAYALALKAHRQQRNSQIIAAVYDGARTIKAITARVYPGLPLTVLLAARMTVKAHIEYLEAQGALQVRRAPWGINVSC